MRNKGKINKKKDRQTDRQTEVYLFFGRRGVSKSLAGFGGGVRLCDKLGFTEVSAVDRVKS